MSSKENAFLNQGSENKRKKDHSMPYFHYKWGVVDGGGRVVRWTNFIAKGGKNEENPGQNKSIRQVDQIRCLMNTGIKDEKEVFFSRNSQIKELKRKYC